MLCDERDIIRSENLGNDPCARNRSNSETPFFRRLAMSQMLIYKMSAKTIVFICVLLMVQTSLVWAADEITGVWEITMEFNGRKSFAMLSVSRKEDGTLAGKWGRDEQLSDVKFQDGKLTFVRTVGPADRQFTMSYEGTLKDGRLEGTLSSDWGELAAVGARPKPKPPVLGHWDVDFTVGDRDINAGLSISEKPDGTLVGKWTGEQGEHVISNVKLRDGKLTFTRKSKINDFEFETYYEGLVKGHKLTGMFKNEMGQWQVNGNRVGAPLVGEWDLTTVSDWGTRKTVMKVFPDLTGRYEFFGSEIPMKDVKLEGDQVTFVLEMGFGDEPFQIDFKGKLDGAALKGEFTSSRGTVEVTGQKVSAASVLVGKWELTTTSPRGTRTRVLTINDDMTGTYQVRDREVPVKELKFENGQLTFTIEMSFGDRQFEMDFKGTVQGDQIQGEFTTSRGTREVTGKKVN
jgi:hypothetical protein